MSNSARTQNGHIRNDTRDVSRRISPHSNEPICRRNCVARDRACTRVTPRNLMVSSHGDASGGHRGGVRMPAPDRSTPASPWCYEPVGKYGAGACGAVDCCLEREPQSRTWRPLRSGASCRLERRHVMDVVVERCAGLDVHRDSVVATVRLRAGAGASSRRAASAPRSASSSSSPTGWRAWA